MRKLTLKLDELAVESFETAEAMEERGTVRGAESTGNEIICTCTYGEQTCFDSCYQTCQNCGSASPCGPGGPQTGGHTCATGNQIDCSCVR